MTKHQQIPHSRPAFRPPAYGTNLHKALEYLKLHRGATRDELEAVMGCKRGNVHSYLQRAIDAGVIERGFYLTPLADKLLKP